MMPRESSADWIVFKRGGEVNLPAHQEGQDLVIRGPEREHNIPRSEVRDWLQRPTPVESWNGLPKPTDAKAYLDRIRQGLRDGLVDQIEVLIRQSPPQVLPELDAMTSALKQIDSEWTTPTPTIESTQTAIRGQFEVLEGRHFVILHQLGKDSPNATELMRLLENVLTAFFLDLADRGFQVNAPTHKLVHVHFAKRDAYQAYLRRDNAQGFLVTRGFYHPKRRVSISYDSRDDADLKKILGNPQLAPGELERRRLLWELAWRERDHGSTAHELIHQLIDHTGWEPQIGVFPLWLHEGWAMQFESIRDGRWAGLGRPTPERINDWNTLLKSGQPPLSRLVAEPHPQKRNVGYYAQSWSLILFLRDQQPNQLQNYINTLRSRRPGSPLSHFQTAFSPNLNNLQQTWIKHIEQIK